MQDFKHRILVAEDDAPLAVVLDALFSHAGHEVRIARDGLEALAIMRKNLPDLITTNLEMAGMSGFEFLSVVRRRFPHIPVIVISGTFRGYDQILLADALFNKGEFNPEQLLSTAQNLMNNPPDRPYPIKASRAPVWLHRNGRYVVLTCTECLRSFSVEPDAVQQGVQEQQCIHCGTVVKFILEPKSRVVPEEAA